MDGLEKSPVDAGDFCSFLGLKTYWSRFIQSALSKFVAHPHVIQHSGASESMLVAKAAFTESSPRTHRL